MNPVETHEITELIARLRDEGGYTILVIEHDMHVVEGISDRVVALDHGVKIAEGSFDAGRDRPAGSSRRTWALGDGAQVSDRTNGARAAPPARGHQHVLRADAHPPGRRTSRSGEGELVCLLGGNASGKSTTLKTILGIVQPRAGSVVLGGEDVTRCSTAHRIERGLAIVPENRRLFGPMTVLENLRWARTCGRAPTSRRISSGSTRSSRCSPSAGSSSPGRSPAASSRWSRWAGR